MKNLKLIEALSNLHGASGHEDDVISFISRNFGELNPERDSINNLYLRPRSGKAKKPLVDNSGDTLLDCIKS